MRHFLHFVFSISLGSSIFSQEQYQVWSELAVKNKWKEHISYSVSLNNRSSLNGAECFFGQLNLKYTKFKWVKPSIDYRYIADHIDYTNYSISNRLNLNVEFKKKWKRFEGSARLRYQTTITGSRFLNDLEFDQTLRLKSELNYDIHKVKINPFISGEWFYDPTNWEYGKQFSKFRGNVGVYYPISASIQGAIGYMYDVRIHHPEPQFKHILSLSLVYNLDK